MFGDNGSSKKGIALQTLEHLFSGEDELLPGTQSSRNVKVSILEIQGENTYDLVKQQGQRRLKMKPGAKGATLQGSNVLVLYPQIDNVVKRRHSQPTKCNASSSRSHCMVIIEVSEGGGCLVLVDMAGSENIEEAGTGVHSASRRQTGDINKDSSLLKRVMIALAEGATHVPYRESELTMRLKASFEAGAQVLMVLCASQEAAEVHKTKSTLDFGALAKSITRFQETAAVEELKEAHGTLEPRERARLRQLEEANQEQEVEIKALRSKMHGWDHSMADMQAFIRRHSQQDAELNAERQKNALLEVEVLRLQRALADSGRGGSSPSRSRSRSTLVQLEPNTLTGECTPSGQKQQPQEQAQQHSAARHGPLHLQLQPQAQARATQPQHQVRVAEAVAVALEQRGGQASAASSASAVLPERLPVFLLNLPASTPACLWLTPLLEEQQAVPWIAAGRCRAS
eukprot:jgi/Mesen1/9319/ME000604S08832